MSKYKMTARPWKPQDLLDNLQLMIDEQPDNYLNFERDTLCAARDYLEKYFQAEEESRFVVLPCKVGDTVWFNTYKQGGYIGIRPHKVEEVAVSFRVERDFGDPFTYIPDWNFGKTVFLTKEEAEAALKEEADG